MIDNFNLFNNLLNSVDYDWLNPTQTGGGG